MPRNLLGHWRSDRGLVRVFSVGSVVVLAAGLGSAGWAQGPVTFDYFSLWNGVQAVPSSGVEVRVESDVNGEVGHPLVVSSPRARCQPGGGWGRVASIISGSLPPGIRFNHTDVDYDRIEGIPTARGHWIVTLALRNLSCNGVTYPGFQEELRFHITGSGEVHQ